MPSINFITTLNKIRNHQVQSLKVIAFTHKSIPVSELGQFFLGEENHDQCLHKLIKESGINELMYLSTCNRIEFIFTYDNLVDSDFLKRFFQSYKADWSEIMVASVIKSSIVYEGESALRHLMEVASSLDSMVVGEREIITQVRNAYERCKEAGLSGDMLRLVIKNVITTAKRVFTETRIAENPVSIVSLAFRKLRSMHVKEDARFIIIGAGETNANFLKYLSKHGYYNFSIFNRTKSKAQELAQQFQSGNVIVNAFSLDELKNYSNGFDVLISCTSSETPVIGYDLYKSINKDSESKILIDLAVPADIDANVINKFPVHYMGINELKEEAERNLSRRENEINSVNTVIEEGIKEFHSQIRTRRLEIKMLEVPQKIREIKNKAINDVFSEEVQKLDDKTKELLNQVLDYVEKKYISVPMVMAKEIILEHS